MHVRHHDDASKTTTTAAPMLKLLQKISSPPSHGLIVTQPTPSSVCFTVSTRPAPNTVTAYGRHYARLLLRAVIGTLALLALIAKWDMDSGRHWIFNDYMGAGGETKLLAQSLQQWPWRNVVAGVAVLLWLVLRRGYTEESFLVLRGLGVQTSTSSTTYLHSATTRFIPATSIQDIFIHEAFRGFEVRFYLAVVVKGEEDVVVVFPKTLPRRDVLEVVWRGARACLYYGIKKKQPESAKEGKD